jgi:large subunit ribosomal protein L5
MKLAQYYKEKSVPMLKDELKIDNIMALPKISKVIVSVGLSQARFDKEASSNIVKTLEKITGQKPVGRAAKKAISNFKMRKRQIVAYTVTLRGERMYDFMDKLINVTLPRIRDFRGIHTYSIDKNGNINLGLREQVAFPEIKMEEMQTLHGLGITIVTTAKDKNEAKALLKSIGAIVSEEKRSKKDEMEEIKQREVQKEEKKRNKPKRTEEDSNG